MREKAKQMKDVLCKFVVKLWTTLALACAGFLIFWLCIGAIFFGGVGLA